MGCSPADSLLLPSPQRTSAHPRDSFDEVRYSYLTVRVRRIASRRFYCFLQPTKKLSLNRVASVKIDTSARNRSLGRDGLCPGLMLSRAFISLAVLNTE